MQARRERSVHTMVMALRSSSFRTMAKPVYMQEDEWKQMKAANVFFGSVVVVRQKRSWVEAD